MHSAVAELVAAAAESAAKAKTVALHDRDDRRSSWPTSLRVPGWDAAAPQHLVGESLPELDDTTIALAHRELREHVVGDPPPDPQRERDDRATLSECLDDTSAGCARSSPSATRSRGTSAAGVAQVLIPPDADKRKGNRPGWNGGLYSFMRRVLDTETGSALYRRRQHRRRA
jgi:hypothetical protein